MTDIRDYLHQSGYSAIAESEYETKYNNDSGQNKVVDFSLFDGGSV